MMKILRVNASLFYMNRKGISASIHMPKALYNMDLV